MNVTSKTRRLLSATFLILALTVSAVIPAAAKTISVTTGNKYAQISAGNTYNVTQSAKVMRGCLEFKVKTDGGYEFLFSNYKGGTACACFEVCRKKDAYYICGPTIAENNTWVKKAKNFTNADIKKYCGDDIYRLKYFYGKSESAAVKELKSEFKYLSSQAEAALPKLKKGDVVYVYLSPAAYSYKCSYKLKLKKSK